MKSEIIQQCFEDHARVFEKTKSLFPHIERMASVCADALKQGNKILLLILWEDFITKEILSLHWH